MKLAIAADHGGFELKNSIKHGLEVRYPDLTILDLGVNALDSVDYPDFADKVAQAIRAGEADRGILVCGTGIGMCIRANKFPGIRAAVVFDPYTAQMAKAHNDANVICLGGRTTSPETAIQMVQTWLDTPFEGGRHVRRVEKLDGPVG
jgi:ribose 5-phosphate isomerase B